ncbi:uncharacterized protein LOC135810837 [Sycon ciliatum]|uniref:uncharacterized protein LOC135810837 n=1 Tax=Sycon ciliatum TaxID=27933 RepID=UPI0020ADEB32|eukprot:scpid41191/ scgid11825/ 
MLRGFILLLFILSFFCGLASLFGNDWASIRREGQTVTLGLWWECRQINTNNTMSLTSVTGGGTGFELCLNYGLDGEGVETRVLLTRWIAVGGLGIGIVTFLLLILAVREDALDEEEKGNACSSNFLIVFWLTLQGLAMVASLSSYSHYFVNDLKDMDFSLGWAFAIGWASAGVFLLSGFILTLGACLTGDCRCSDEEE